MQRESTGRYELTSTAGETVRAFWLGSLQADPPLVSKSPRLQMLHERVLLACVPLD